MRSKQPLSTTLLHMPGFLNTPVSVIDPNTAVISLPPWLNCPMGDKNQQKRREEQQACHNRALAGNAEKELRADKLSIAKGSG